MAVIGSELGNLEVESYEQLLTVCAGPHTCLNSLESNGHFLVVHVSALVADKRGTVFPTDFALRTETPEGGITWLGCKAVGRFDGNDFMATSGVPLILAPGAVKFSLIFHVPAGQIPAELVRISTRPAATVARDLRVRMVQKEAR
jgi:hypothetical protein